MKFLKKDIAYYLLIFIFVLLVFHAAYGLETLNPTNINWLMSAYHDWGTHYLGWAFYRNDPWTFPLGNIQSYYAPIGTNIGFTDSIPLFALIFKPFSSILPEDFQYFGIWIFICHLLLAIYSYKIFDYFKVNKVISIVGTIVLAANPVLIFRGMHPALCAQWLLVGSIYYYLIKSDHENVININKKQAILLLLSSLINPYLTPMVAGFSIILPLKNYLYDKTLSLKLAILFPIISLFGVIVIWISVGLLSFNSDTNLDVGNIYGLYAFNLNSFFNSYGHYSKFIPHLGMVTDNQHEGFGYLGIGMILLFLIAIFYVLFFKRRVFYNNKSLLPLLTLSFFLFVFAVSNQVSYGTNVIFNYPTLGIVEKLGNIFRAIGRFIWVDYYLILVFSIIVVSKISINKYLKLFVFLFIFSLQFYDIENLLTSRKLTSGSFSTKLQDDKWINIFKNFDEVITYPPFTNNLVYSMDYQDLSFLALKAKRPITNGYVARENLNDTKSYKDSLVAFLKNGDILKNQIFVTNESNLKDFNVLLYKNKVKLHKIDNFYLLHHKDNNISSYFNQTKEETKTVDSIINTFQKSKNFVLKSNNWKSNEDIQFNIESYTFEEDVMQISGWAFMKSTTNNLKDSIFVALTHNDNSYLFSTTLVLRGDISIFYKRDNLDNSGFSTTLFTEKLPKQQYETGIVIKDSKGNYHYAKTDKSTETGKKKYQVATIIKELPKEGSIIDNLELMEKKNGIVKISGWAALEKASSENTKIKFILHSKSYSYQFNTASVKRPDVTAANENKYNYDDSGFQLEFQTKGLEKGKYEVFILIENTNNKSLFIKSFKKFINL